jgi:ankyrin repeat protein
VRGLLEQGVDVNARRDDGLTALMVAAGNGRHSIVEALLEAGADVDAK